MGKLTYAWFSWLCWFAYLHLPWAMVKGRFGLFLLPHAGAHAYSDEPAALEDQP